MIGYGAVLCADPMSLLTSGVHADSGRVTVNVALSACLCWQVMRCCVFTALHWRCRYDDLKTAQENIDLQTTILSRFDLIFIVKDERSMDRDKMIAQHVLNVHKNASAAVDTEEEDRKVRCLLKISQT